MTKCYSLTTLIRWAQVDRVPYLDGDESLPYVQKDGLYHYFAFYPFSKSMGGKYVLVMTSNRDLQEKPL